MKGPRDRGLSGAIASRAVAGGLIVLLVLRAVLGI